jgi:tRNA isopentenyl-2-thiomethyl-A-37 hydroxylase MiaE
MQRFLVLWRVALFDPIQETCHYHFFFLGSEPMESTLDPDITAMQLSDGEKWGLQVYRNYSRAFEEHRVKQFVEQASLFEVEVKLFEQVVALITTQEARAIPVIASAYADDRLKEMFQREIPQGVPGGRSAIMSGFGPLARLSQRIQLAFAFGWLSKDLLTEFDHIRKVRNDLSHKWDVDLLEQRLTDLIENKQSRFEESLGDGVRLPKEFYSSMNSIDRFRVRSVWLLGRMTYETRLWVPALKAGISPEQTLYGQNAPLMLQAIAGISVESTRKIIGL